jgi:hypothetical protein
MYPGTRRQRAQQEWMWRQWAQDKHEWMIGIVHLLLLVLQLHESVIAGASKKYQSVFLYISLPIAAVN